MTTIVTYAGKGSQLTTAEVDVNFNNLNNGKAEKGANSDITSLSGLTTALTIAQGGTGATSANAAADAIGAYRKGTILGVVSQSAGVPTGAIIESGNTGADYYIRYADGTQVCWGRVSIGSVGVTTASGGFFTSSGAYGPTYAKQFAATPACKIGVDVSGSGLIDSVPATTSTTAASCYIRAFASTTATGVFLSYVAFGRWY